MKSSPKKPSSTPKPEEPLEGGSADDMVLKSSKPEALDCWGKPGWTVELLLPKLLFEGAGDGAVLKGSNWLFDDWLEVCPEGGAKGSNPLMLFADSG